jgi:hypothetical protein
MRISAVEQVCTTSVRRLVFSPANLKRTELTLQTVGDACSPGGVYMGSVPRRRRGPPEEIHMKRIALITACMGFAMTASAQQAAPHTQDIANSPAAGQPADADAPGRLRTNWPTAAASSTPARV